MSIRVMARTAEMSAAVLLDFQQISVKRTGDWRFCVVV